MTDSTLPQKSLIESLRIFENPEIVKIKVIKRRHLEQIYAIGPSQYDSLPLQQDAQAILDKFIWSSEILGRTEGFVLLVYQGTIFRKVHISNFIHALIRYETEGTVNDKVVKANKVFDELPQLFEE